MASNQALYAEQYGTENRATRPEVHRGISQLFEPAPLGVGKLTPGGRWSVVTENLCHMLGYTRTELLKKTLEDLTHPADWFGEKELLANIVDGKEDSYEIEKRLICRSGSFLFVTQLVAAVRDDAGTCLLCTTLIRVNEAKRMEELLKLTVELSPNAVTITDQNGKIVLTNPLVEKIFGYRQRELLGKSIDILMPNLVHESRKGSIAELQVQPIDERRHLLGQCKNGTVLPAEVRSRTIETGRGTWTITSIVDMREHQERKRASLSSEMNTQLPVA